MCYFHVLHNVKKNRAKYSLDQAQYNIVKNAIDDMRSSLHAVEYCGKRIKYLQEWSTSYPVFKDYFLSQWLEGKFNNWQLFNVPAGLSTTNSPIESFNKLLKSFVTGYTKPSVYVLLKLLMDRCINYYSLNLPPFKWYRPPDMSFSAAVALVFINGIYVNIV